MKPRNRWQGWTIVDEEGNLVLAGSFDLAPFTWELKRDADEAKDEGQKVVRCEVRVIK